jgi:hypothetical protein
MKATGGSEGIFHIFLKSALGGVSGQLQVPIALTLGMKPHGTTGWRAVPHSRSEGFGKKKNLLSLPGTGRLSGLY